MPSNNTGDQDRKQSHRVVWRGEKPMVALDQNGVVQLFPLRLQPDCLWDNSLLWDCPALSFEISDDAPPPEIFLSRLIKLAGRRREAISELQSALFALREAIFLAQTGAATRNVLGYLNDIAESVGEAFKALDA